MNTRSRWHKSLLTAALAVPLALLGARASAAVSASLDSQRIAPGDTVQLTLERDGRSNAGPDLTPLRRDFDILGTSRSSSIQIINGITSANNQVVVTLAPKHDGRIMVPRIEWSGERTAALTLDVAAGGGAAASSGGAAAAPGKVFLKTQVDLERPYVQAGVQVTVRLYTRETLYHADLELPDDNDVLVQQIGSDERGTADRNGVSYQVLTRRYLVFPQHSGRLTLPGPVLSAEVASRQRNDPFFGNDPFNGFFGGSPFGALTSTRPIRLHGDPITLDVRPRPADATKNYWLPARNVTISSQWNPDGIEAHVGDPLTVDLHLEAEGLTAAQLPDLSKLLAVPDGIKDYPDQAKLKNAARSGTVVGTRDQSVALIADRPGHYRLPALTLEWWDTKADAPREAMLPARQLTVLPAPGQPTSPAPAAPQGATPNQPARPTAMQASPPAATPSPAAPATPTPASTPAKPAPAAAAPNGGLPWPWISLAAVGLWLVTVGVWLWSRRRGRSAAAPPAEPAASRAPRAKAAEARTAFLAACRANDARTARRSLLDWGAAIWPDSPPAGLNALAERLADPSCRVLLRSLDRACYAGGAWQGEDFAAALGDLPAGDEGRRGHGAELEPLYR